MVTIHLALSERAAQLTRAALAGISEGLGMQAYSEDQYDDHVQPADAPLLDQIVAELDSQLGLPHPPATSVARDVAEAMAAAGAATLNPKAA